MINLVAEQLRVPRAPGTSWRGGGDEFVVVQADILDDSRRRACDGCCDGEAVRRQRPRPGDDRGIGIALAPQDSIEAEQLLKSGPRLYKSKSDGRTCFRFFTPAMDAELQARLKLERTIRDAVQNESFELHFQPLIDMPTGRLTGFEALLRLRDADGNDIPPTIVVPMAEDMGLIGKIGTWVIRSACLAAAQWPKHLTVAVNLSPAQFHAGSVCEVVSSALAESGLEPVQLEFEITEALLLRDTDAILDELGRLKALGVAVVMDDFGTGCSSLELSVALPSQDRDRPRVHAWWTPRQNVQTIIKTIVGLAHSLHMRVTAEASKTVSR